MRNQAAQVRSGLLGFALDQEGREVLDHFACHTQGQLHQADLYGFEQDDAWLRRSEAGVWEDLVVSGSALQDGFEAAIRDALDLTRLERRGSALDVLDLVLVGRLDDPLAETFPRDLLPQLRRRFQRIDRVLWIARGEFEPVGQGVAPGEIQRLPFSGEPEGVDLVVLLHPLNMEGRTLADAAARAALAAEVIEQLTLGELAQPLFEVVQRDQHRLAQGGTFCSCGIRNWRLDGADAVTAVADVLKHQMIDLLTAAPDGDDSTPEDSWPGEVESWLESKKPEAGETSFIIEGPGDGSGSVGGDGEPEPATAPRPALKPEATGQGKSSGLDAWKQEVGGVEERGAETLGELLATTTWGLPALGRLMERRGKLLKAQWARRRTILEQYMPGFARWYAQVQTGQLKGERIPTTIRREVPKEPQSTLFGICMVLAGIALVAFLAALGNFAFQEYKLEIGVLLAISFLGAMILAAGGLNKEEVNTSFREKRPSDLMPEFILRRRRSWATAELLARTEDAATGLAKSLEALQGPGQQSQRNRSQREFPFSPEVCAILLDHRHITAGESLREFWRHHPASILWDPAEPLLEALVNHAREQCAPFASVTWAELFRILGERKVEGQVLREVVERAQRRSLPWMRIPGFASQVFLALPQELPDQMQKALRDEFPAPKTVVETPGSGLVVLHLTQGYRQPDAQSDSP